MTTATGMNCGRMHTESVRAAVVASRGCGYLPRYVAYRDYKAGMRCSPDCSPACHRDAGLTAGEVGVAGGSLGFGLMRESNYPCQLSRNGGEKSQYGPAPEV